jgi:hypothetical protein
MCGTSPNVAAPNATALTKCRRLNLPSRKPPQHAQEASRRTICNVVIVPLSAAIHDVEFLWKHTRSRSYYTCAADKSAQPLPAMRAGSSAARSTLPCAAPARGSGAGNRYPLACLSSAPGISSQSGTDWKARPVDVAGYANPIVGIVSQYLQPLRSKSKDAISSATAFAAVVAKAMTPSAAVLEVSGAAGVNWPSYFGRRD